MTVELDVSDAFDLEDWLSSNEAGNLQRKFEERIIRLLFQDELNDSHFRNLAMQLAWMGTESQNKGLLAKAIAQLHCSLEGDFTPCGWSGPKKLWEGTCNLASKTVDFVKEHKTEILLGIAVAATGAGLVAVTGYSCSVVVGGIVVAGVGSVFASNDPPNPHIPQHLPYPSKSEREIFQQPIFNALPNPELPGSPDEFLVTSKGIWSNGQFYSTEPLMKHSLLFSSDSSLAQRMSLEDILSPSINTSKSSSVAAPPCEAPSYQPIHPQPGNSLTRSFFETIGREVLGPEVVAGTTPPELQKSHFFTTAGKHSSSCRIGGINGMNTSLDYAVGHANHIGQFASGLSIDWVYNNSHGVLGDGAEIFTQNYLGISLNTAQLLTDNWIAFHEENKHNLNARYLQFCHSQGAIHVRNALLRAPQEICDRIIVVAIAPAAIIPENTCFRSFNYASKKDIVPFGELLFARALDTTEEGISPATEMALEHLKELILLDPHPDATGIDHEFRSPTFSSIIEDRIQEHLEKKGIYE